MVQGYSPYAVDIMNMTDGLLTDMAGNAMSTTVVGAFMFAALICFRDVFNFDGRNCRYQTTQAPLNLLEEKSLVPHMSHPALYDPVSVVEITALAKQSVRLCLCEGLTNVTTRQLQRCKVCKYTSCVKCGHNPSHHYEQFSLVRKQPVEFKVAIKKAIPLQINLSGLCSELTERLICQARKCEPLAGFDPKSWKFMIDKIKPALSSRVFYRSIRRAHCFQITYDSPDALLTLEISSTGVEWKLFANVPKEPLGTSTGKYLRRFAIARMRPTGEDIMKGQWQFWIPEKSVLQTTITSSGPLEKSFENERGLPEFSNTFIYSEISIAARGDYNPDRLDRDIVGEYVRSAECGQAWNSVHARKSLDGQESLLLTFNQRDHSGDPKNFCFSFTNDIARKRFAEELAVVCDLPSSWRQPTVTATATSSGLTIEGVPIAKFVGKHVEVVDICLNGHWVDLPDHNLDLSTQQLITYHRLPEQIEHIVSPCGQQRTVFSVVVPLPGRLADPKCIDRWTKLNRANQAAFWKDHICLVEKELVLAGHRQSDKSWIPYPDASSVQGKSQICKFCAPNPPSMQWTFATKKGDISEKQIPVEEPEEASKHERAIKNRPSAMDVMYRISASDGLEFKIAIDPTTLVHRAIGSLLRDNTSGDTKEPDTSSVRASYRLVTDDGKSVVSEFSGFVLRGTDNVEPPASLVNPFADFSTESTKLRPEQSKALAWMLDQEHRPQPFSEQVIAEASVKKIGYLLEAKATRHVTVAGGILAQAVGFGKTILILSIVALHLKEAQKNIAEVPDVTGAIRTQASLVLVPPHLIGQWASEAKTFMGELYKKVLIISKVGDLDKLTVGAVKEAVMVLVDWSVCSSSEYKKAYAQFAGKVEYDDTSTWRARRNWHQHASKEFADNVQKLKSGRYDENPESFKAELKTQLDASIAEANAHKQYKPSKHVTGAKYTHALAREPQTGDKRKRTNVTPSEDFPCIFNFSEMADGKGLDGLLRVLLEMFHWSRVAIDEITYLGPHEQITLHKIKCDRKWLLTGTPRLGDFHDVKAMASMLGINLGRDDHSIMKSDVLRTKMSEFTGKFLSHKVSFYSLLIVNSFGEVCDVFGITDCGLAKNQSEACSSLFGSFRETSKYTPVLSSSKCLQM